MNERKERKDALGAMTTALCKFNHSGVPAPWRLLGEQVMDEWKNQHGT